MRRKHGGVARVAADGDGDAPASTGRRLIAPPDPVLRIAISGAAGLLGSALADYLTRAGHGVIALVHRNDAIVANDLRVLPSSPWTGAPAAAGHVATLKIDIEEPDLAIDDEAAARLAGQIDLVVHAAALTAFEAPPGRHHAVNVAGTAHLLRRWPGAPFLHVSTAYVCGTRDGMVAEGPADPATTFSNGYEASKAAAEALVRAAAATGRQTAIARPSVVLGAHDSGTIRDFDTFYAVFRLLAEGRVSALPAARAAAIDFVPIDHVVGGLADIIAHWPAAVGQTFHLTSGAPVTLPDFHAAIARVPHFRPPAFTAPALFDEAALPPLERRIYARAVRQYMGYFARAPQFEVRALPALSGRHCPPMDAAALDRMIAHAIARGFLKPG